MKIILTQEVSGLGTPGDIVEAKDGYGRNYLLPQGFAIQWTKHVVIRLHHDDYYDKESPPAGEAGSLF